MLAGCVKTIWLCQKLQFKNGHLHFFICIFLHAVSSHLFSLLLILPCTTSRCLLDLSLTFTTKLPISVNLFISKAGPRHLYGNHHAGCVDLQRAWKLFRLAISSAQVIQKIMAIERQTMTSTKTDSDAGEVK